ncbi:MAG: hypothetical protein JSU74_14095 [Candidatus Zixiibacteriota bacterium]|nr:MAG: hypothetical protein JSU74_14095 [candidate division Zixibacteria bacterium]
MISRMTLRGALHMHTTLSHDGSMSLDELVGFLKSKSYDYIAITEHSYDVDDGSMQDLVERSQRMSTADFLIIPGLEFRCHGWLDIIGYGVTQLCDSDEPAAVIDHIHSHDGVAVLAHPNIRDYPIDNQWVSMLDGCEIWNVSNEGKYLPQSGGIKKYQQLVADSPGLLAFTGLDLHRPESYCNLSTMTYVHDKTGDGIIGALKEGAFRSESPLFSVGSDGDISAAGRFRVGALGTLLNGARSARDLIRR